MIEPPDTDDDPSPARTLIWPLEVTGAPVESIILPDAPPLPPDPVMTLIEPEELVSGAVIDPEPE
jgi:hypothetical protein